MPVNEPITGATTNEHPQEPLVTFTPAKIPCRSDWLIMICCGGLIGTLCIYLILLLAAGWVSPPLDGILSHVSAVLPPTFPKHELSTSEKAVLGKLLEHGNVIGMDTIVSGLMNYYNTIITILLGLIAAACALSFMYIRSASILHSEDVAERAAEKSIKTYFKSVIFRDLMDENIKKRTDDAVNDMSMMMDQAQEFFESRSGISERLRRLEGRIAELDMNEESEGDEEEIPTQPSTTGSGR